MLEQIKDIVKNSLANFKGLSLNRKILVIESDDWGSIRMPSKKVYDKFADLGIRVDLCPYNRYDNLECAEDLEQLYITLGKIKDKNGNPPVITANTVMANPDFGKIKDNNFEHYYFEPFTTTLKNYYPDTDVFSLWQEGINNKFLYPQLHGREHLNPEMWMQEVRENEHVRIAFEHNFFGLSMVTSPLIAKPYLASLIYKDKKGFQDVSRSIEDAATIFEKSFGFTSSSFIAPLYTWEADLEPVMKQQGIKYIQAGNSHKTYDYLNNKRNRKTHRFGSRNSGGQIYLNRNCIFEPSLNRKIYTVEKCLKEIESAFFWNKPAVISIHRLNFIGSLSQENRETNLHNLDILLREVLKKWPETEFMSSAQLGDITENKIL